jgi:hypothetical protein
MRAQPLLLPLLLLLCGRPAREAACAASLEAPWRTEASARSARASRVLAEAPAVSAAECSAAWSLPYARRRQLGDYPVPLAAGAAPRLELFILFVVDPHVLLAALRSLLASDALAVNVTVLDTSPARELSEGADEQLRAQLADLGAPLRVHTPLVPLVRARDGYSVVACSAPTHTHYPSFHLAFVQDFQRAHNAVQELAYTARLDAYFVMHSDAVLAPGGAALLLPFSEALLRARWRPADAPADLLRPPLGVIFFNYDTLALFNPAATLTAGVWDTNFLTNYGADVDYYHRLGLAGFRQADGNDSTRVGAAIAALGRNVTLAHETSHSLKSTRWACTRELRMTHTFEGEWRERYMERKWGRHRNASVAWSASGAATSVEHPPPAAAPAGWAYSGCFREGRRNGSRALPRELPHVSSAAACVAAAEAAGLHVAAVQNGVECWACSGCDYARHGPVAAGPGVGAPCAPEGGPWLMQVYTRQNSSNV